jgi:SNF2 family DNA or RNA helicase
LQRCKGDAAKAKKMMEHFNPQIISKDENGRPMFKNLPELQKLIKPHTYRVLKKDCLDLPDKVYMKRFIELNKEQRKAYNAMRDEFIAEHDGSVMVAALALPRMTRLQQITGGFFTADDGTVLQLGTTNPKMEASLDICEQATGKVIIWARFKQELELIADTLEKEHGVGSVARYWGNGYSAKRKDEEKVRYINSPNCRFFVSQQQAGGTGLDGLQKGTTDEIYFSNTFPLVERLQSEDRAHRDGMGDKLSIHDLEAEDTLDSKVIDSLRNKKEIADEVTGDQPTNWI